MRKFAIFLSAAVAIPCAAQAPKKAPASPVVTSQSGELLPDEQIQQVLNRLTFGARPGDAAKVRSMGIEQWIDLQLHPERIDDRATDQLVSQYSVLNMKTTDIIRDYNSLQQLQRQAKKNAARRYVDGQAGCASRSWR